METNHIVPVNDLIEHTDTEDCSCNPKVEIHENGKLVIHNAIDRREVFEQRNLYNENGATPCEETTCNSCGRLINACECVDSSGKSIWKNRRRAAGEY